MVPSASTFRKTNFNIYVQRFRAKKKKGKCNKFRDLVIIIIAIIDNFFHRILLESFFEYCPEPPQNLAPALS